MDDSEFMLNEKPFLAAAKLLREAGEYQDAMALAKKALKKYPKNADFAVMVGLLSLDLQEPDHAEKFFKRALSTDPANTDALKSLGLLLDSQGREAEGFDILLQYLENVKWDDYDLIRILLDIADKVNKQEKTATALKEAWEKTLSPRIGFLCARQLRIWSKNADALPIMQILAKHSPTPEILNEYAIDLQHSKQFEQAIKMYELAIQKALNSGGESKDLDFQDESQTGTNVDISIYLSNLSSCYLASGRKEEALAAVEKSLSVEQRIGYNWFAKAKALSAMQRYREAAEIAKDALEIDRALCFLEQAEKENLLLFRAESLRSHQRQIAENYFKIEQLTEGGQLDKAKILFGFSQYHDAAQFVKNALEQVEQKPGFLDQSEKEGLSLFQEQLKKNDQLLKDVLIVLLGGIQNYPQNLNFYFEAANIYEALGQIDEAIKVLENAFQTIMELSPNEIAGGERSSYFLGVYYILLHKNGLGENAWEKYVRFAGKNTEELLPTIELDLELILAGYIDGPAAQIIEQVYKHQPENPQSIQFMFKLRFEQGRLEDCISVLSQSVNAPIPDKYRLVFLNNLGYIQLLQGNLIAANNTFAKALVIEKDVISAKNDDVFNFPLGVAFYLDNKVLSANWVDKSKLLSSSPVQLWQTKRTIDALKCNLVTLALAEGDADEATALVAEILSMPHEYVGELALRNLALLFVARFRNDIRTARFSWQNYLKNKEVYVSEGIFKKIHPEFHAWLN
ncbi:MAG: tetratricopeptide repeat protein [Euryarchaeota archaeon]|nr:tetratricopeptide repeat protein [Euryarchaeota archaeon]